MAGEIAKELINAKVLEAYSTIGAAGLCTLVALLAIWLVYRNFNKVFDSHKEERQTLNNTIGSMFDRLDANNKDQTQAIIGCNKAMSEHSQVVRENTAVLKDNTEIMATVKCINKRFN